MMLQVAEESGLEISAQLAAVPSSTIGESVVRKIMYRYPVLILKARLYQARKLGGENITIYDRLLLYCSDAIFFLFLNFVN